jgi:hypothetical protein
MADNEKVLINLATGLEEAERVTVAFLVATAGLNSGKQVGIWLTKGLSGSPYPATRRVWLARGAHRFPSSLRNSSPVAVSCSPARSASTPAD